MAEVSTIVKLSDMEVTNAVVAAAKEVCELKSGSSTVAYEIKDGKVVAATVEFHKTGRPAL